MLLTRTVRERIRELWYTGDANTSTWNAAGFGADLRVGCVVVAVHSMAKRATRTRTDLPSHKPAHVPVAHQRCVVQENGVQAVAEGIS